MRRRDLLVGASLAVVIGGRQAAQAAPNYPEPTGAPGAPFADPNLKLAVMSGLMDKGILNLGTRKELAEHVLRRPFDEEKEGYQPNEAIRDYLLRYPLTTDMLNQADSLVLDGGNSIYFYIWRFWDGEDYTFNVDSLAGIGKCPNITSLDLTSMISFVDLKTLTPPLKLQKLNIGVEFTNIPALLDMPYLRSVRIWGDDIYRDVMTPGHPSRVIMETLKARGVAVWVHWISSDEGEPPAYQ